MLVTMVLHRFMSYRFFCAVKKKERLHENGVPVYLYIVENAVYLISF